MLVRNMYKNQDGYIALISTTIIALVLLGLTFTVSSAGYFTRFDSLDSEYKRVSLGLAESCQNMALLKLGQNFQYAGNETITIGTDAQGRAEQCTVGAISPAPTRSGASVNATIPAQSNYLGAFTNISTTVVVQNPNVVHAIPTTLTLAVNVPVGANIANFSLTLDGSSVTSGQTTTVTPAVQHTASVTSAPPGYSTSGWAGACASGGTITPALGTSNSCYISYTAVPSTAKLTLVANIPVGENPANFHVFIDGTEVSSGQAINVTPVIHTATYTMPMSGYQASPWSGACNASSGATGSLTAGQTYTCAINFTVPSTACADTVMMLDRTGSMSQSDRTNEGTAAQ